MEQEDQREGLPVTVDLLQLSLGAPVRLAGLRSVCHHEPGNWVTLGTLLCGFQGRPNLLRSSQMIR